MNDRELEFLKAACAGQTETAAALQREHPDLVGANIFTACAAADVDSVARFIRDDPSSVGKTEGPEEWTPLVAACRSTIHTLSERHARDARRVAAMLMDAGASANSFSVHLEGNGRKAPIPVLHHACMSDHPALVGLLLERGAKTQDGESIYHAAQYARIACLDVLLKHGANVSDAQQPYGNTPLYFLAGHHEDGGGSALWFRGFEWLLEHGADPNVPSGSSVETPLHTIAAGAPKPAAARALLAHGANPNIERKDGRTPYRLAVRHGNRAIASLLMAHGAHANGLLPMEEFLGACLAADERAARALLASHPELSGSFTKEDKSAVLDAARQDNGAAIRLMAALGFPLAWPERTATPLHEAAWLGHVNAAAALIELGAPLDGRDRDFGCSPITWAAHGSGCNAGRDDAYCTIVDLLIDRGAKRGASFNKSGEPPEQMASPRVKARLEARGFTRAGE